MQRRCFASDAQRSDASDRNVYSDRFQNFLGEVKMLRELNHPNICLLMGTCFVGEYSHAVGRAVETCVVLTSPTQRKAGRTSCCSFTS